MATGDEQNITGSCTSLKICEENENEEGKDANNTKRMSCTNENKDACFVTEDRVDRAPPVNIPLISKPSFSHPLEPVDPVEQRFRNKSGGDEQGIKKSLSLPVEPMRHRAFSTGHSPTGQLLETSVTLIWNENLLMIILTFVYVSQ